MRVTRESLLKLAQETVDRRVREDRGVIAAYLCGSLLEDEFMLGGTADIDLFFLHISQPPTEREILRLTDEVHLDIAHHAQKEYRRTRELRMHPWIGPTLAECTMLYDPQHFMDFTQASVRGQFDRPDRVVERSRTLLESARQIWFSYQEGVPDPGPDDIGVYLRAVGQAANAVASLSGPPLTERRCLLRFPERARMVGRPGLYAGLLGLLGAVDLSADEISSWLPAWQAAFQAVPSAGAPARLHPDRLGYYRRSFDAVLLGEQPLAVLWPLLRTWTMAVACLPPDSEQKTAWVEVCSRLGLLFESFVMRISALDAYLDLVEETLDEWAQQNGVWSP
jgi:hypothetical protein